MFKKITSLCFSAAVVCAMALQTPLQSAQLDPSRVPADAKWLLHVDLESFHESDMYQKLRELNKHQFKTFKKWFNREYGIELPDQLRSVTMFSRDYREYTGTVILEAIYEPAAIEEKLKEAMNYRTTPWQEHTLHTVTLSKQKPSESGPSGDEEMTVAMLDEMIVIGSSVPNTKDALKLLDGQLQSLAGSQSNLLDESARNAWIYGAAIDLAKLKQHPVAMPVLAQHSSIYWSCGERNGKLYEQAVFEAQSEEVAEEMRQILEGLVSYEQLWARGIQPLSDLMQNVEIRRVGTKAGFHWEGDTQKVVAAVDDIAKRVQSWTTMFGQGSGTRTGKNSSQQAGMQRDRSQLKR